MRHVPHRRTISRLLILLSLLVAVPACRTVSPEAGLERALFEKPGASLGYNPRGYWFAVSAKKAALKPYVTVSYDGQTELFYAIPRGERAAQLLPLTPVGSGWFEAAREAGATPNFVQTLDGAELSDPVGVWNGDKKSLVEWHGPATGGEFSAVALPAQPPTSPTPLYRVALGTAHGAGNKISAVAGELAEPAATAKQTRFLLLPEQSRAAKTLHVVDLSGSDLKVPDASGITVDKKQGPSFDGDTLAEYATLPAGRHLGADLLVFTVDGELYVANIGPDHARIGGPAQLVAAVAEGPMKLTSADAFGRVARGYKALREGRTLAATYWLRPEDVSTPDNAAATGLRLAELPSASHRSQWTRVALLEGADGMTADRVLYLARAHALEGDYAQASSYGVRATDSFIDWPSPTNHTGAARAKLITARAEYLQNHLKAAIEVTRQAADEYKMAGDKLRRADAEMTLAAYQYAANRFGDAIKSAKLARSRYYHAGSPYFSALAEIHLAEYLLEAGETNKAAKMAGYAVARMEKFDEPVGLNRASIVEVLAKKAAGQKHDVAGELKNGLARARELDDPTAEALAASALVTVAGVDESTEMLRLSDVLIATRHAVGDMSVQRRSQRAIATMCGQGLASLARKTQQDAAPELEQACQLAVQKVADDPETLRAWLTQGYKALQSDKLDLAGATANELTASLDTELEQASPTTAANILFFQYAVESVPTTKLSSTVADRAKLDEGLELLDRGLDPTKAAEILHGLAREHRARGLTEVAAALGTKAMDAARAAEQYSRERELLFFLLQTYHRAGRANDVLQLARDGRKVVSRAGPGSEPLEARVLIYQSDAEYRLGRASDAGLHRSNALATANKADAGEKLSLLLLSAQIDLERGANETAKAALDNAAKVLQALSPEKRASDAFVGHATRANVLRGDLQMRVGDLVAARKAYQAAVSASDDTDNAEVLADRAHALGALAGSSVSESQSYDFRKDLSAVLESLAGFDSPEAAIEAYHDAVAYYLDAGDATEADDTAQKAHDAGYALAPRTEAVCLTGRVALFAGKSEQAVRQLSVCSAQNAKTASGAFAGLLVAMQDDELDAEARAQKAAAIKQQLQGEVSAEQQARLDLISTLPKPDRPYDERRAKRLAAKAASSAKPADVAAYASYLLSSGRITEATAYIDEHSTSFFARGQESPGTLIRLRLEAMVRQLQPVDAALYAERALSETRNITQAERAQIDFLLAQNEIVAGRIWRAAELTREARKASTERDLTAKIDAFAKKFPPIGLK